MEPSPKVPGFNVHTPAYLAVSEKIRSEVSDKRIGQLDIKPSAVTTRAVNNLVESSHSGLGAGAAASIVIPNGSSATFTFTLRDNQRRTILAVPDMSWFIDVVSNITQWPNASFGMGNMPSLVWNDWGSTDNVGVVSKLIVRNNTGSDQFVIGVCRWRVIKNSSAQFEQGQISTS